MLGGARGESRTPSQGEAPNETDQTISAKTSEWQNICPKWLKNYSKLEETEKLVKLNELSQAPAAEIQAAVKRNRGHWKVKDFAEKCIRSTLSTEIKLDLSDLNYSQLTSIHELAEEQREAVARIAAIARKNMHSSPVAFTQEFFKSKGVNSAKELTEDDRDELTDIVAKIIELANLDVQLVRKASTLPKDVRRELLKTSSRRFKAFMRVPAQRKDNVSGRAMANRTDCLDEFLNKVSKNHIVQLLATYIKRSCMQEEVAEALGIQPPAGTQYSPEDMIAFMCVNHKITYSLLELMYKAAPKVFPSPDAVDRLLKERLGSLKVNRVVTEDGDMEARMFIYRELLLHQLHALLPTLKEELQAEDRILVTWVIWLDAYSVDIEHHDPEMKKDVHRCAAAGSIAQIDYLRADGTRQEVMRPEKADSRKNVVPIMIARKKEDSSLLRRLVGPWDEAIEQGEQQAGGFEIDVKGKKSTVFVETWLACDMPMRILLSGGSSCASATPSTIRPTDEAFARVLARMVDGVDPARTLPVLELKGAMADLIHSNGFTLANVTQEFQRVTEQFGDQLAELNDWKSFDRFHKALQRQYAASPDKLLLAYDSEKKERRQESKKRKRGSIGAAELDNAPPTLSQPAFQDDEEEVFEAHMTDIPSQPSQGMEDASQPDIHLTQELPNEEAVGSDDIADTQPDNENQPANPHHLNTEFLVGALMGSVGAKKKSSAYVEWLVGWLGGQKTRPILPIPPLRAPIPLLHLEESMARFIRNAAATIAFSANKLDELEAWWRANRLTPACGTMQGNDSRRLCEYSENWLAILKGCPKVDDLAEIVRLWRKLQDLLRERDPNGDDRVQIVELCERLGVELNRRFPATSWNNYLFELIWNMPLFANDHVPVSRKSEDKFEAAIWLFKRMPTSGGGGLKSIDTNGAHREDPEYQILARLFNTSYPGAMTTAVENVVNAKLQIQKCGGCKQTGHNIRTCPDRKVRAEIARGFSPP